MTTSTPFEDLLSAFPRIDREWQARKARLMAMTATQRVAAMRAGDLTYRELAHWSAVRPDEVPRLSTGSGAGGGEFEWIAAFTPEIAEATADADATMALDGATVERSERIRAAHSAPQHRSPR